MTCIQFWRHRAATYTAEQNTDAARVCESRADRLEQGDGAVNKRIEIEVTDREMAALSAALVRLDVERQRNRRKRVTYNPAFEHLLSKWIEDGGTLLAKLRAQTEKESNQ